MNRKKRGSEMIPKYIHVNKEAENSYSFAVGDELRKALVAPWTLPILPFSLLKRVFLLRNNISRIREKKALSKCVFILDLEKMRMADQKAFTNQAMNYSDNCIGVGIGHSKTETKFDHSMATKKELGIGANEWNLMLENLLLGVIRAHRPEKLVFVGKYPYAGLMSIIRKCHTERGFYWIHVRSDQGIIEERSTKFTKSKSLSYFTDHDTVVRNTIFFDYSPPDNIRKELKSRGVNIINTREHAEYLALRTDDPNCKSCLMRNQTVFMTPEAQGSLGHIPDYLLPNLVVCDSEQWSDTILSVISFRKNQRFKKDPLMQVEAKIDLWLN
jgi:hypothetical protein